MPARLFHYFIATTVVGCLSLPISAQQNPSAPATSPAAEQQNKPDPATKPASDAADKDTEQAKTPEQHPLLDQAAAIPPQPVAVDTGDSELAIFAPIEPQGQAVVDNPVLQTPAVTSKTVAEPAKRPGSGLSLGKMALSLAIVVAIVLVLGWGFKKLTLRLPGSRHLKVISTLPLGPKERLLVIEVQGKQRVIGVTPHSINLLFELENPLPDEKLASNFHTQLQSFLKK